MSLRRRAAQILRQRLGTYLHRERRSAASSEDRDKDGPIPEPPVPGGGARAEACRILDVRPDASPSEIRSAYRRLCKEFHPDRFRDDDRKRRLADQLLAEINVAYSTLLQK